MLKNAKTTSRLRRKRMEIERLEKRDMFATISWANRGTPMNDLDGFNGLFGVRAELARGVVDAALETWQKVIVSFNYSDAALNDTFQMSIRANPTGAGTGANGGPTAHDGGKPKAGSVVIGRGADAGTDGIGDGGEWFLDPTPQEHSEFLSDITNAFSAKGPAKGGPASEQADLYTVLLHEFGHALGLTDGASYRLESGGLMTPVTAGNPPEQVLDPKRTPGKLWKFEGPSVKHLMTSYDSGGATGTARDAGFGLHTAVVGTNVNANGTAYAGANDLMNPNYSYGERRLIPQTLALILQDAYGYTIRTPADWPDLPVSNSGVGAYGMNFYAMLDRASGQLLIQGSSGNDRINITSNGISNLTVSVDIGVDVAGTGSLPGAGNLPAFRMVFPTLAPITSILVLAGAGNDQIRIDALPKPLRVEGGRGDDQLILGWDAIPNLESFRQNVTFDGGIGTDTLTVDDSANRLANRAYTLTSTSLQAGRVRQENQGLNFDYSNVDFLNLRSGVGPLSRVDVRGNSASVTTTIDGAARAFIGAGDVSSVQGRIQIVNPTRATALTVNDSTFNRASKIDINPTNLRVFHETLQTVVTFNNATLSSLTINGGTGGNEFNLRGTRNNTSTLRVTLNTGRGNDVVNIGSNNTAVSINGQAGFDTVNVGVSGIAKTLGELTITNAAGFTSVNVFDNDFTGKRTGILYRSPSTGNLILSGISGDISMRGSNLNSLTVRAGKGGNTFRIHDTLSSNRLGPSLTSFYTGTGDDSVLVTSTSGSLIIEGQNGTDTVSLGSNGLYQTIKGKVTVTNELGTSAVIVDNSADDLTPRTTILYKNATDGLEVLSGLGGADIVMRGNDLSSLSVLLGDANNTIRVHNTPQSAKTPNLITTFTGGLGGEVMEVNGVSGALAIETGAGNNDITVGSTAAGLDNIQHTVDVRGGGITTLIVQDTASTPDRNLNHVVTPTRYSRDGMAQVLYSNLTRLSILGGNANDSFDVADLVGSPLAQRVMIDGGGQTNTLDYSKILPTEDPGDPPTDQVSLYLAENNFADVKGINTGLPSNGVGFAPGRQGQAFQFDGVDDYVDLGNDASLNLTESVTYAAWVNADSLVTYKYLIADFAPGGAVSQGSLGILGQRLFWFQTQTDGTTIQPEGATDLVTGQWYHLAAVRDGTTKTVTLYVNGVADGTTSYVGDVVPIQGNKILGTSLPTGFPNDFFHGRMDDVSIFNRALSAAEIKSLYGPGPVRGVTVNLVLGTASGLTDGVRNIQNVLGGGGNDILVGAGGNQLNGGGGRDLLIAGPSASELIGGAGHDILIGGTTTFDRNSVALDSILSEWVSGGTASQLTAATVVKNNSANRLTGNADRDLFFATLASELVDFLAAEDEWFIL